MKKYILLFLTISCATLVSAQSLSLSLEDLNVSNDTIYVIGTTDDVVMESRVTVNNLTDKEIEVKAKKAEVSIVDNTENAFCWGACYPPFIFEPEEAVKIIANGSDASSFIGDYAPEANVGTSIVRYTFYAAANPSDSVSVIVLYQVGAAGVFDWTLESNHFKAYPNPTSGVLKIDFPGSLDQTISLNIISITGQTVFHNTMLRGQTSTQIDLSRNPKGYYFVEIRDQMGNAARKKILKTN